MSHTDHNSAATAGPRQINWKLVSMAIVAAGMLVLAGANAHLIYVAVASQPDCVLPAKGSGETVKFQAAKPAC